MPAADATVDPLALGPRIGRRRFLGFAAGALAGSFAGRYSGEYVGSLAADIDRPLYPRRGPEQVRLSVCRACPGGCGVRVRCIGDRPVKVEGGPLHPVSGGRLCPKGQASLQALLHPDRIRVPLRRSGPRGSLGSFHPVSWTEALDEIAVRLSLLRRQGRPEALCFLRGPARGAGAELATRFLEAFGSPNDVRLMRGDDAAAQALLLTQGVRAVPVYDLQGANYVLSIGSAHLEASASPVHAMRAYGEFRQGRTGRRGKLVHAGTRLSVTASRADEWIPIHPGSEGTFALGVASVLVAEGLYDRDFVEARAHQFEDFEDPDGRRRDGLRTVLQRDFSLERTSRETGVPVNRILHIAREFAEARPGLAIGPRGGPLVAGQLFDHLAVHVLNGLAGNIDAPGGVLVPEAVPRSTGPALEPDSIARAGLARPPLDGAKSGQTGLVGSDPEALAEGILAQSPYRAEALFLLEADPVFASYAPDVFAAALEQVPLVVSLTSMPDDSSLFADWILPTTHALESWDLDVTPPGVPFPIATLAKPVVAPAHEARTVAKVLLELARKVGGSVAEAMPWREEEHFIRMQIGGLYAAQRGAVLGTEFDEAWIRLMERAGWWAPGYRSEDELWERMQETGGWWDPFYDHLYWKRVIATESGRFEFRPLELVALSEQRRSRTGASSSGAADGRTAGAALALQLFEPLPVAGGTGAELPFLQEILDPGHGARWDGWAELNPATAHALGVRDRQPVELASTRGSIRTTVRVTDRVVPGVVAVPVGLGKRAGGRWAAGRGSNPLRLLSPVREPVSGLPDLGATRVRIVAKRLDEAGEPRELHGLHEEVI